MKIGTVVDGKVVVEGETLTESETITVLLREDEEAFELTPDEEEDLLESIGEIERGELSRASSVSNAFVASVDHTPRSRFPRGPPRRSTRLRSGGRRTALPHPVQSGMMSRRSLLSSAFNLEFGAPARRSRVRGLRRTSLPRIRYYLYYRVWGSALEVLAFRRMSRDDRRPSNA
jgi:hypothetical protein